MTDEALISRLRSLLALDTSTGHLTWRVDKSRGRQGTRAGSNDKSSGYRRIRIDGVQHREHRVIWWLMHGAIPDGLQIDHINRQRDDNRPENLRLVTSSENRYNSDIVDAARGYHKNRDAWRVHVHRDGVRVSTRSFRSEPEASAFYAELNAERAALTRQRASDEVAG